jgi:hypothetical protein
MLPRQPVADLPPGFPLVPGGIPGQYDANGFLRHREVACLARPDYDIPPGTGGRDQMR